MEKDDMLEKKTVEILKLALRVCSDSTLYMQKLSLDTLFSEACTFLRMFMIQEDRIQERKERSKRELTTRQQHWLEKLNIPYNVATTREEASKLLSEAFKKR
uniref:Uncharacterized protein n=1 Tax=viral metagenome TaxID=1070528 RepID=A0A6H1ZYM7_9ZZZZ